MAYETIGDLIKAFREDEEDSVGPEYFWSDPQLVRFANGALVAFAEKTLSIVDEVEVQFSAGQDLLPYAEQIIDVLDAELAIGGRTWGSTSRLQRMCAAAVCRNTAGPACWW